MPRSAVCLPVVALLALVACESIPVGEKQLSEAEPTSTVSSIVWLRSETDINSAEKLLNALEVKATIAYPLFNNSFVVELSPEQIKEILEKKKVDAAAIDHIEENIEIIPFQPPRHGCGTPTQLPHASPPRWNITRVGGPVSDADLGDRKVWIVDSGVEARYDGNLLEIREDLAADCTTSGSSPCNQSLAAADDEWGHGTMIAGIIGGKQNSGNRGVMGVVVGAPIVPVKIFHQPGQANGPDMSDGLKGLQYVFEHAQAGDVVNISWGGLLKWTASTGKWDKDQTAVEDVIRTLVSNGIKVAIAAGNLGPEENVDLCPSGPDGYLGGGYVQSIVPARVRSGLAPPNIGAFTASASDEMDNFWYFNPSTVCSGHPSEPDPVQSPWGSFFGNDHKLLVDEQEVTVDMAPDFAEPGVDITSLWISAGATPRVNTCTGTSYAAPHLAAILLLMDAPASGVPAMGDPSAWFDDNFDAVRDASEVRTEDEDRVGKYAP